MPQINPSLPIIGQPSSSEDPKTQTALSQLVATVNALDSANIVDGSITAADLAAAVKPTTILGQFGATPLLGSASMGAAQAVGTYWLCAGAAKSSGVADGTAVPLADFGVAGYDVSGLTARARVACSVLVNNTAPACSFTFGLHGIQSVGGGASTISLTSIGVFGNTAAILTPAANSTPQNVSADFAIPTSGIYGLAVVTSAPLAANSVVLLNAALQIHWA